LARPAGRLFDATVPAFLRQPRWAVALTGALLLALAAGLFQLGDGPQLPQTADRSLLIHWEGAPGTSLPEMTQTTTTVINELRALHGVEKVGGHLGRAITSDQVVNVNKGEVWVTVADDADYNDTVAAVKSVLGKHPSVHSTLMTYPDDRVRAVESGAKEPVAVRVYGPDLQVLHQKAEEIRQRMSTVAGVVDAKVETIAEEPNLEVRVNLEKAQKYGINPGDVRRTAATYFSGLLAGNLYQEQKIFDVVVVGSPAMRQNVNSVANVLIDTSSGEAVRIGDIADIRLVPNPTVIRHDATLRALTITGDVKGRDLGSVLNDVTDQVKAMPMPLEYHAELVGTASQLRTQTLQTIGLALAALVGVLLLLQAALGSWRLAALVLVTLPLAAGGAVLAAFIVGGIMTVGALAGLLATVALTVRAILNLVHAYQQADSAAPGIEAVIATTRERAPVILLSTVATVAAFIPLLFLGSAAGTEIVRPLAVTLVGGLITSTLVTFFVLPFLYLRIPVLAAAPGPARLEAAPAPNRP
jgi:Cu/Ag efflux pump CusA